jgi:hypothetical protein
MTEFLGADPRWPAPESGYFTYWLGLASNLVLQPFEQK